MSILAVALLVGIFLVCGVVAIALVYVDIYRSITSTHDRSLKLVLTGACLAIISFAGNMVMIYVGSK